MKRLKKRQIGRVVCTILQQLAITTPINVVYSWGITNKTATQIKVSMNGRKRFIAALMMEVYGFNYCGKLYITLNSVKQVLACTPRKMVYCTKKTAIFHLGNWVKFLML